MSVQTVWCFLMCVDFYLCMKLVLLSRNARTVVLTGRVEKKMSVERKMSEVLNSWCVMESINLNI